MVLHSTCNTTFSDIVKIKAILYVFEVFLKALFIAQTGNKSLSSNFFYYC